MPAAYYVCNGCSLGQVLHWDQWTKLDKGCNCGGTMVREAKTPTEFYFDGVKHQLQRHDSQRQKLYDAEREAFGDDFERPFGDVSVETMQQRTDEITGSKRWRELTMRYRKEHWPRNASVTIGDGARHRAASYRAGRIELPKWARTEAVLMHELAHAAVRGLGHHWPFARTYIDLVSTFIGVEAARKLKAAFKKHGVRWTPKRRMSPEDKARLAERGRQALAAYSARKKDGK